MVTEAERRAALAGAQRAAARFFARIEQTLIRPGIGETQLTREIAALGEREFGITVNWHKRIVRAGPNTLKTFFDEPPEHVLGEDDILFVDLGPVFEAWEADFGRTYVLGDDPHKLRLRDDTAALFAAGRRHYEAHPEITGAELYAHLKQLAADAGWEFAGPIAAHLVGEFPHKELPENLSIGYANAEHHTAMRGLDSQGRERHWILEIHLVDRARRIGGFYEELLTV